MNAVEEIYVLGPSVLWSSVGRQRTYLPEQNWFRTGPAITEELEQHGQKETEQDTGKSRLRSFQSDDISSLEQIHRDTESALAEFDRQVKEFDDVYDNLALVNDVDEDLMKQEQGKISSLTDCSLESSSLCLDTSSLCLDSMDMPNLPPPRAEAALLEGRNSQIRQNSVDLQTQEFNNVTELRPAAPDFKDETLDLRNSQLQKEVCEVKEEVLQWKGFGFGKYQDVDLIATESVSSGFSAGTLRSSLSNRVEYCERDRSDLYMTVRPPGVERKSSHGIHTQSRKPKEERGEPVMYNKKYSMDSDYREYYRDRPRGEFLTRGAALSSQAQQVNTGQVGAHPSVRTSHEPTYGATRRQPHDPHSQYMSGAQAQAQAQAAQAAQAAAAAQHTQARLGRNVSSEKIGQQDRRNPTILRKKLDVCVYLMSAVAVQMEVEEGANATVTDLIASLLEEEELALPRITSDILSLWMTSPLLEVQLKPHHKPFFIRREWNHFLQRFSSAPQDQKAADEPVLSLQRNVFCSKREEQSVKDHRVLELLYEEAKFNILTGRYPCEISDYIMLGGIQARLEIGPYDLAVHSPSFFKQNLVRFLPEHAVRRTGGLLSWLPWSANAKSSPEARLIEQFKAIPSNASPKRLVRKYLEFCWSLPYYGSAFFRGQIETPAKSLTSLVINEDSEVIIAINSQGLYVIDPVHVVVLLGLKFEELSWDYAKPSQENNEDCLPCLFIQFCVIENGRRVSKILQVFSRQAVQMDALISAFVDEIKQKAALYNEDGDNLFNDNSSTEPDECLVPLTTVSRRGIPESCLSNKLSRLTLATFDDEGHCIGHMGSWSFSS